MLRRLKSLTSVISRPPRCRSARCTNRPGDLLILLQYCVIYHAMSSRLIHMTADRWMIRGTEFENCNCAWGCPCQFGARSTHGHCEAFMAGHIEDGTFNGTSL